MAIVVDIETKDPDINGLSAMGEQGFITGVALLNTTTGDCGYYHPEKDREYIQSVLLLPDEKILHNSQYDLTWLCCRYGFAIDGRITDTMVQEALIDPLSDNYKLDYLCHKHGLPGKNKDDTIDVWWKEHGGKGKAVENMDKIPFQVAARYGIGDVQATRGLAEFQGKIVKSKKLEKVCDLESNLIPVIMRMKANGARIDIKKRDELESRWTDAVIELEDQLTFKAGIDNINSAAQIARYFHEEGIASPKVTDKGNESWDKNALEAMSHPIADKILKARSLKTVLRTFLQGGLQKNVGDRIYTTFFQTGRDEGGTITGRFSSAHPNLQNIPSDLKKGGEELRSLFIPEDGCVMGAFDYKQIEYRLLAHYAIRLQMTGWKPLRDAMLAGADFHSMVGEMLGWGPDMRKIIKTLNFGVVYGMGKQKMFDTYRKLFILPEGWEERYGQGYVNEEKMIYDYVDWVFDTYFNKMVFVKPTCSKIRETAKNRGFVQSIGGRIHPTEFGKEYKSVNKLIQGSAADILKIGLVNAEKKGLWDVLKIHLTVHDENVFSCPQTKEGYEAMKELERCMMTEEDLAVPLPVDTEVGFDWGHCTMEGMNDFSKRYL